MAHRRTLVAFLSLRSYAAIAAFGRERCDSASVGLGSMATADEANEFWQRRTYIVHFFLSHLVLFIIPHPTVFQRCARTPEQAPL